jgi:hypothetical protein
VFFPFKVWAMYKYRRGKLAAKGVQPMLKHLIFFRTALESHGPTAAAGGVRSQRDDA